MFLRVELIARSWSFFSRINGLRDPWIAKFSRCARLSSLGSAPPGSGDPFSNAHPRHAGGGVATQCETHDVSFTPAPCGART